MLTIEQISKRADILEDCVPLLFDFFYSNYETEMKGRAVTVEVARIHTNLVRLLLLGQTVDAEECITQLRRICTRDGIPVTTMLSIQMKWGEAVSEIAALIYQDASGGPLHHLQVIAGVADDLMRALSLDVAT